MIAYWPVLAYVALVCVWTGAMTISPRNSRLTGRPRRDRQVRRQHDHR